jgi:16S rRNA processing protein RimM
MERQAAAQPRSEGPGPSVVLGQVVGAHGLRGALRVRIFGDGPEHLLRAAQLCLARREGEPEGPPRDVTWTAPGRPGEVRLALSGVRDRDAALALRGRLLLGDASRLEALPEGDHYWFELVGCRVETPDGRAVGRVRELWQTAGHDLLVVEGEDGRDRLVPTAPALCRAIDVAARRVVVADLPGLLDPA